MANVINATSTGNGGLITQGDDSGILNIQTNETTAITVDASQKTSLVNDATISGLTVGKGGGAVSSNTAIGASALSSNSAGTRNTVVGSTAGSGITGSRNTVLGDNILAGSTSGNDNVAVGDFTMRAYTGSSSTAVGAQAMANGTSNSGNNNTAIGQGALNANASGANNTAVGASSLTSNTTASNNTAVGYQAGYALTTGAQNYFFGYQAGQSVTTGNYNVLIGAYLGGAAPVSVTGNNWIVFSDGQANIRGYHNPSTNGWFQSSNSANWATTSDQRIKTNIVDSSKGLAEIQQIKVRNFNYKTTEDMPKDANGNSLVMPMDSTKLQTGFIAQELQTVFPESVFESQNTILNVDTDAVFYAMVKAIQELKAEVDSLKAQINGASA